MAKKKSVTSSTSQTQIAHLAARVVHLEAAMSAQQAKHKADMARVLRVRGIPKD